MNHKKVASSLAFKFAERLSVKAIGLIISIVLARLLTPDTFGLIAIVTVCINIAQNFVTSGLGTALVQNKTTENEDYSTVFWLSVGIAALMIAIIYALAPTIASFYQEEALILPLRILSLSLLFNALHSVQTAKQQREMRYKTMLYCNLIASVLSGTVSIAAAYWGAGIWALVIHSLMSSIVVTSCTLVAEKWAPCLSFSWNRAKIFWGFGWKMLVSGLLCSIYNDVRSLIIGKKYTTTELAYYNRGQQFPDIIANTVDVSIQSVMLPVMSSEQDSQEKMNDLLLRTMSLSMLFVCPVMLGLAAIAETLIPLLLTNTWAQCIPYMELFCFANLTLPVMTTNLSVIKAMGRSDIYMRTEIIRRIIMTIILLATVVIFNSVLAIAISYLVSSVVDIWVITGVVRKMTGITKRQQIQKVWKTVLAGFIMAFWVYLLNLLEIWSVARLGIQVLAGAVIYLAALYLLKDSSFGYVVNSLRNGLKSEKKQ